MKPFGSFWVKGEHVVYVSDGGAVPESAQTRRWKEIKSFDPIVDLLRNPDLKHAFRRAWESNSARVLLGLKVKK
jgi:hypothetical protein